MEGILDWIRNYSMVVLLLTALTQTAAKKEYRRYIQLFVEIIWVITLVNPLLSLLGKSGDLFEHISYDSFWQGLEGIKMDREKLDFPEEEYYLKYYERAIEADVKLLAENSGYEVLGTEVSLDEEYGVEQMELKVKRQWVERVVIGEEEERGEREEILALRDKIAAYYQIGADKVWITE